MANLGAIGGPGGHGQLGRTGRTEHAKGQERAAEVQQRNAARQAEQNPDKPVELTQQHAAALKGMVLAQNAKPLSSSTMEGLQKFAANYKKVKDTAAEELPGLTPNVLEMLSSETTMRLV